MKKTTTSTWRGHTITQKGSNFIYADTLQPVSQNINRDCGFCNLPNTEEGHDGCLGILPEVMNACCGHGNTLVAYIQYKDGTCIYGEAAIAVFKKHCTRKEE
jgi:hypothetical protein